MKLNAPSYFLTEESRWWHSAVATRYHDTDASLHKWNRELHNLWPLFINSQGADGHVGPLGHHLVGKEANNITNREIGLKVIRFVKIVTITNFYYLNVACLKHIKKWNDTFIIYIQEH